MARYTHLLTVAVAPDDLERYLVEALESCDLEVIHKTNDYVIAREIPGGIPFAQLVTVEVLIDNTRATNKAIHLNCVIKNEELPLRADNHCFKVYQRVSNALTTSQNWDLVESVASLETN
jgi:hypothetical protein